ncbi:hypothetical protein [Longirhabdus pacifica]|uniref:hypothetical protein n=1 Tax=Longirhabdus pacifica TaxID=2305227 RepID=UPI0010088D24|nr:hypothetical protein [Longirhabdus pacifica]
MKYIIVLSELSELIAKLERCLRKNQPFVYDDVHFSLEDREQRIKCITYILKDVDQEVCGSEYHLWVEKLSDLILYEELTDHHPYKSFYAEYPVLSKWQISSRKDREYNIVLAYNIDMNKQKCCDPVRRKRTAKEEWVREVNDQKKLREQNAYYKQQSQDSEVESFIIYS